MIDIVYDYIEILSTNKVELQEAARDGYTQYGLRANHDERWLKLRRKVKPKTTRRRPNV
jgi:hypothetical protein